MVDHAKQEMYFVVKASHFKRAGTTADHPNRMGISASARSPEFIGLDHAFSG